MKYVTRKTMLYKTNVEYGDYTINHVLGCSHGCLYPCYAMMMAKRFGKVKNYEEWLMPRLAENTLEILDKEIPKFKNKIKSVQLCFTTDPFMYGQHEIIDMSLNIVKKLNDYSIKCVVLTKGVLPLKLTQLSKMNEIGISIVSLSESFRMQYEPFTAPFVDRIQSLRNIHNSGVKTWVSIEPYPTPNIIDQNFDNILNSIGFVDKIIFGKWNYNSSISKYKDYKTYYNLLAYKVIDFCIKYNKEYHIKEGTMIK